MFNLLLAGGEVRRPLAITEFCFISNLRRRFNLTKVVDPEKPTKPV